MRRMNVQFTQIGECIELSLFAVDQLPRNPPLERGELLLLQLTKSDAVRHGKEGSRIEFALVYERHTLDHDGSTSRRHWPAADKTWRYILHCSETVHTIPFSMEQLGLSRDYAGQSQCVHILPEDERRILPYVRGGARPSPELGELGVSRLIAAIRNYDEIVRREGMRTARVSEHQRRLSDPWLGDALKNLYEHRCQICLHDFRPKYGIAYADTRFIRPLADGGGPVSRNTLVLCPNHNRIVDAAGAAFDDVRMAYRYDNGLVEKLTLRDHLLN